MPNKKAVILLSGGLDSATVIALVKEQGFSEIHALSFLYGQKHKIELERAKQIATRYATHHKIIQNPNHKAGR